MAHLKDSTLEGYYGEREDVENHRFWLTYLLGLMNALGLMSVLLAALSLLTAAMTPRDGKMGFIFNMN